MICIIIDDMIGILIMHDGLSVLRAQTIMYDRYLLETVSIR